MVSPAVARTMTVDISLCSIVDGVQVIAQEAATSAALAAIILVYLLLVALFRLRRPSRNAA